MKVLLLAGGDSNEREVSLTTGKAVSEALMRLGHQVRAIDPASGQSLLGSDGDFIALDRSRPVSTDVADYTGLTALTAALGADEMDDVEVVFIALHGGAGENGSIQCLLELSGIAGTGSSMTASAVAMDKAITKRLFTSAGVPTPDWQLYRLDSDNSIDSIADAVRNRFAFPIIVKPNDGGSTIGLTRVTGDDQLRPAIETAAEQSRQILVEQYIPGRELTVAMLDGEALPVVEIKAAGGLYDYEAKYTRGKSEYIVPADVSSHRRDELQQAAMTVCNVIGVTGLARVDFILAENGRFYCLEVNTVPGMTSLSLAPMAAQVAGIEFDQLIDRLLRSALKRHEG